MQSENNVTNETNNTSGNKVTNEIDYAAKLDVVIENIAKKEGYVDYYVKKTDIPADGGGYMGILLAVDIKGKTNEGDKETNMFVKQMKQINIPMIYDVNYIYKREKSMYLEVLKEAKELQEKEGVPVAERFMMPKAFDDTNDGAIILENLVAKGYTTNFRLNIAKLEYAELSVKNLARLHGLSFVMQVKRPDYFEKIVKNLDCVYIFNDYFRGFRHNVRKFVTELLPEDVRDKVRPQLETLVDQYPNYMNDTSCMVKTICHGDFRPNNNMVKEIDGKPTEVITLDYQISFYGNPVLDLIYFIFWSTDQEFRKNHMVHLKQLYYQYLGTFLGHFGIEVETVFPKQEYDKQFKEKLDFGLMVSIFYLPFLFPPEDDVPDFSESKPLNEFAIKVDEKYTERFRGIVDDFVQWGYLKI